MKYSIFDITTIIRSLIQNIDTSQESFTHTWESGDVLKYIKCLLEWFERSIYKVWINEQEFDNEEIEYVVHLSKQSIYPLMDVVQGLCQGTTDKTPFAMATLLNHEANSSASGTTNDGIALVPIFRKVNFNYDDSIQKAIKLINNNAKRINEIISGNEKIFSSEVEENLNNLSKIYIFGFFYPMAENTIDNVLLFHELGHHIFFKSDVIQKHFKNRINDEYIKPLATRALIESRDKMGRESLLGQIEQILSSWILELLCDVFAVLKMGPSYMSAYKEISEINEIFQIDEASTVREQIDGGKLEELKGLIRNSFNKKYPPDSFRMFVQWKALIENWLIDLPKDVSKYFENFDELFSDIKTEKLEAYNLNQVLLLPGLKLEESERKKHAVSMSGFLEKLIPEIIACAKTYVPDVSSRKDDFWYLGPYVSECFKEAIVPSTIVINQKFPSSIKNNVLGNNWFNPLSSTVLNIARMRIEDGCGKLYEKMEVQFEKAESLSDEEIKEIEKTKQLKLANKKIIEWVEKSIEDWILIISGVN